jgi:hypothetical protein
LPPVCLHFISTHSLSHRFHLLVLLIASFLTPVGVTSVEEVTFTSFGWRRFECGSVIYACVWKLNVFYLFKTLICCQASYPLTNITFLDIIHRPVYLSKHDVSEIGFFLPENGDKNPVSEMLSQKINRTVSFLDKDRTMVNVQKYLY